MKLALQLNLIPGKSPSDKAKWAKDQGVEGIEIAAFGVTLDTMKKQADAITKHLPVCSVCGNHDETGKACFLFLDPDKANRRKAIDGSKGILKLCGELGAVGQIVPPIFGGPKVPDLSPVYTPLELEDMLMLAACEELGAYAAERKTLFMLEPLNRYEQHYLKQQADAVRIIDQLEGKVRGGVGLLSDFFHMHIEEFNTTETFRAIGGTHTSHIHLADSTRMEPGTGIIDFTNAFEVLAEVGFAGYMAYECGVTGDDDKAKRANLSKSLDYLRSCMPADAARPSKNAANKSPKKTTKKSDKKTGKKSTKK